VLGWKIIQAAERPKKILFLNIAFIRDAFSSIVICLSSSAGFGAVDSLPE
jgi:hypothetical protein